MVGTWFAKWVILRGETRLEKGQDRGCEGKRWRTNQKKVKEEAHVVWSHQASYSSFRCQTHQKVHWPVSRCWCLPHIPSASWVYWGLQEKLLAHWQHPTSNLCLSPAYTWGLSLVSESLPPAGSYKGGVALVSLGQSSPQGWKLADTCISLGSFRWDAIKVSSTQFPRGFPEKLSARSDQFINSLIYWHFFPD